MHKILKYLGYLKLIKEYIRKYRWQYVATRFFGVFLIIIYNSTIFLMKPLLNSLENGEDIYQPILFIALVIGLPLIIEPITFYFRRNIFAYFARDIYSDVYRNIMKLDYKFHTDKETGRVISKILRSEDIGYFYVWDLDWHLINNFATFIVPIIFLFIIDFRIGIVALIALILNLPIQILALRNNLKYRKESQIADFDRNTRVIDTISNYETVRLFGKINDEEGNVQELIEIACQKSRLFQLSFGVIDFTARISGILIFLSTALLSANLYLQKVIDLASLIVVITYLLSLSNGTISLVFSIRQVIKHLPILDDIFELLQLKSQIEEPKNPIQIHNPKGVIEFSNVHFTYTKDSENYALNGICLKVKSGESIALVGPSGGGKSTIAKLLLRYYLTEKGYISIDSVNINDLGTQQVNEIIGVVPQEPILFNRSIKFNIGYSLTSSDNIDSEGMEKVIQAAKRAMIHDFIISLPDGYDTIVGERGVKLSGGQKQRIAIARVLLKNPKIVIFDEATSMLDSESEAAIQKAFRELTQGITTIVIAHRLSTIKNVDTIYVVDNGKIIEQGRHSELLEKEGLYARLWNMQSKGF